MNAIPPITTSRNEPTDALPRLTGPRVAEHHAVQRGDTLSGIVREYLTANGRDHSARAVYEGVKLVAQANGIENPDRIFAGQRIEVELSTPRMAGSFPAMLETVAKEAVPDKPAGLYSKVLDGAAKLSSPYGQRKHPIFNDQRNHTGIDLAATRNTPITSMRTGTVSFSGWKQGYGNTVIVKHENGIETQYSHASKRMVSEGDRVNEDTVVGLVGSTGDSTGPHLHFEVKRNGRLVNPIPYLLTNPTPRTKISYST